MSLLEFYTDTPILATILTLVYVVLWALFIYMLIRIYKRPLR
jgi:hypothetical protein